MGGEGANYQAPLTDLRGPGTQHGGLPAHGGASRRWPPLPNKLSESEAVCLAASNGHGDGWRMIISRKRGGETWSALCQTEKSQTPHLAEPRCASRNEAQAGFEVKPPRPDNERGVELHYLRTSS